VIVDYELTAQTTFEAALLHWIVVIAAEEDCCFCLSATYHLMQQHLQPTECVSLCEDHVLLFDVMTC
jgi:hypothetical protein